MKDTETKLAFVRARAEGKSYSMISRELGIAKATCTSWEKSMKADIDALKQAQLEELYTTYNMKRESRIRTLGGILQDLDNALSKKPLEDLPADKLLELKLKYQQELNKEYIEPLELNTDNTLEGLLEQYDQLYMDARAGKLKPADVKAQLSILEAKKNTLGRWAMEQMREDINPFEVQLGYTSKLLRHEENS